MDESSGKGSKMQAHPISDVVMDIAAFKVSHSVVHDRDTTALQAKKRVTFHGGDGTLHIGFDQPESSPPATDTYGDGQHTSGDGANVWEGSKCKHSHSAKSCKHTHTAVGQFKGHTVQWGDGTLHMGSIRGALEEMSQRVQKASALYPR